VQELLMDVGNHTKSQNTMSMLEAPQSPAGKNGIKAMTASGPALLLRGKGYYNISIDSTTGQPQLKLVDERNGVSVNVSSVDGDTGRYNALGSIMLARKIEALAEQQTDPNLKAYFQQIAKYSYYLGGAEGAMDNVPHLSSGDLMTYNV